MKLVRTQGPLPSYAKDFLQYLEVAKDSSSRTITNYGNFLSLFFKYLESEHLKDLKPSSLTPDHIYGYRLFLTRYRNPRSDKPLKKSTRLYYLVALRAFLAFCADQGITTLPVSAVALPKLKDKDRYQSIKFLSLEQLRRLFDAPDLKTIYGLRDRAIIETLFSTGLRISELIALNRQRVEGIKPKADEPAELTVTGKGDRVRPVYVSPRALGWIKRYLEKRNDEDAALFIGHGNIRTTKSKRLSVRMVETSLEKYSQQAGLPYRVTPHVLRHTFATDLLNKGVDSKTVQEFLGHANLATTQMYLHVTNVKLKDVHKKFHSQE